MTGNKKTEMNHEYVGEMNQYNLMSKMKHLTRSQI